MNLHKLYLTKNDCYRAGVSMKPKGIMVHSTGCNNPNLRRYVGPDDGLLGPGSNHWNQPQPDGRKVCVHAFIGKLADGTIATYQTLPWNMRGWHAGGAANNAHIGFEICEDGLTDASYFFAVYQEAVELCAYLCKLFDLTEKHIICHYEGYQQGLATPHIDPTHWFPKFGKTMGDFRAAVRAGLEEEEPMTRETFDQLMASWLARNNPGYKTLTDVPAYWQAETKALQEAGAIRGSGSAELDISRETLKAAVICKRYLDAVLQKKEA